jgi:hypothetical protein
MLSTMSRRQRCIPAAGQILLAIGLLFIAAAAQAGPVFDRASLAPDAISPNNDGVQEYTEIRYTLSADSADVRILLTRAGGTPVVDTLQVFTRQGGTRSRVFDGSVRSGPVADGSYEIRILGVGTGGEGTEQAVLPLEIDRAAPAITSLALVSPATPVVQNGTRVTLQACMDGAFDQVSADFSALDSGFIAAAVSVTSVSDFCRRFTYTITPSNTLTDRSGLAVTVTTRDRAGNRSTGSIEFCLSNSPPVLLTAALLNPVPVFQNGDQIRAEIQVNSPNDVTVRGDFINLDSGSGPGLTEVERIGTGRFRLNYTISGVNNRPDGAYRLRLYAYDVNGCGVDADSSLTVTLDNAGALPALIGGISVTPAAYSPHGEGVEDSVTIHYTVLEDTVGVLIRVEGVLKSGSPFTHVLFSGPGFSLAPVPRGSYTLRWDGLFPVELDQLNDQVLTVVVRASSLKLGLNRSEERKIELDRARPVFKTYRPPVSSVVRNDRQVAFTVVYDRPGYDVSADFGELDSNFPRAVSVADSGNGAYRIAYTISPTNARPDGINKDVRLTATDAAGNSEVVEDLARFCLSNSPPRLASAQLLSKPGPYRKLDQISLRTKWVDGQWTLAKPLQVTASFLSLDTDFNERLDQLLIADVSSAANPDTAVFDIAYRLSSGNEIEVTEAGILVTARDHADLGCGSAIGVEALRVKVDSEPPFRPTLTASGGVVRTAVDTLRGVAEEAVMVIINRGSTPVDTIAVPGVDGKFSGPITLEPGENKFNAVSVDVAGNLSKPSVPDLVIFYVQGDVVQIPGPFTPGKEFFIGLVSPARRLSVRIFNLDGVEIARLEAEGGDLFRIPWDGKDATGALASSGPYLAVVEVVNAASGRTDRFKKAFVFARRGAGS